MIDFLIIGGGIVGSWIGYEAARRGYKVVITDQSAMPGEGLTLRSSGVLHSGIYYEPGSEKARHSIRGRNLTVEFIKKYNVSYNICGKLITGGDFLDPKTTEEKIIQLYENGIENGFRDLRIIKYPGNTFEGVKGSLGLFIPQSGIVDVTGYINVLHRLAENKGALFLPGRKFIEGVSGHAVLEYEGHTEDVPARFIINSSGLQSDHIARIFGIDEYTIQPSKGEYYRLSNKLPSDILVYPLDSDGVNSLGIHYSFHLNGYAYAGPSFSDSESRTDYEIRSSRQEFYESLNRIIDIYKEDDLSPGYAGIRPTLYRNGVPVGDFIVMENPSGVMHLLGIESPGLTSAPSLAMDVVDYLTAV